MKLAKIPYYSRAISRLLSEPENILGLSRLAFRKGATLRFPGGISLKLLRPLDVLLAKETIVDDHYGLGRLLNARFIIDAGASVGDFSIHASKLYPDATILAFESDKNYFAVLVENVHSNSTFNVKPINATLGSGGKTTRLSDYITAPVDLLKIDCEGAELEILKGIGEAKLRMVSALAIEYHNFLVEAQDRILVEYLQSMGFGCHIAPDPYDPLMGYIFAKKDQT